jgi:hypothetical protein
MRCIGALLPHRWPRQHALQLLEVDGLDEVVRRAQSQRLHAGFDAGVAGAQHDLGVGDQIRVGQQVHAIAVGQAQVQQQDVGLLQRDLAAGVAQRVRHRHRQALSRDQVAQRGGGINVVVDNQCMRHGPASDRSKGRRRGAAKPALLGEPLPGTAAGSGEGRRC